MYCITNSNGQYLKISLEGKVQFTNNESLAEHFNSEREATDFIRKTFSKKKRRNYKAKQSNPEMKFTSQGYIPSNDTSNLQSVDSKIYFDECIKKINDVVNTYLNPEIETYITEMQKYDRMILDIRHWLRDKNTKLNACQGYQAMKKLQDIERERVACKKELQRVAILRGNIRKACNKAENFEYEEYKNREIEDVRAFLFGG